MCIQSSSSEVSVDVAQKKLSFFSHTHQTKSKCSEKALFKIFYNVFGRILRPYIRKLGVRAPYSSLRYAIGCWYVKEKFLGREFLVCRDIQLAFKKPMLERLENGSCLTLIKLEKR